MARLSLASKERPESEKVLETVDLLLGELKKFQPLERSFFGRCDYWVFVGRKKNDAVPLNDTKRILAGLYRGSAHFLHGQSSYWAIFILANLKN
jgi:hypothetical protein